MGFPTPITLRCTSCDERLVLTPPLDEARASHEIAAFTDKHHEHQAAVTVELSAMTQAVPQQRSADPVDELSLPLAEHRAR